MVRVLLIYGSESYYCLEKFWGKNRALCLRFSVSKVNRARSITFNLPSWKDSIWNWLCQDLPGILVMVLYIWYYTLPEVLFNLWIFYKYQPTLSQFCFPITGIKLVFLGAPDVLMHSCYKCILSKLISYRITHTF